MMRRKRMIRIVVCSVVVQLLFSLKLLNLQSKKCHVSVLSVMDKKIVSWEEEDSFTVP